MDKPTSHKQPSEPPSPAPRDPLAVAFHVAADTHAATLKSGSALEVLTAYRQVLVAEIALLRDSGGALDRATADNLEWEIERVDRDLADGR